MKKFSNIFKESVWADIHKRSNSIQVRKEDDVNHMDIHQLYDYVKNIYGDRVISMNFTTGSKTKSIGVEVIDGVEVSICYFLDTFANILIDALYNIGIETTILLDEFDVERLSGENTFKIKEKDSKETGNKTFIKLLDFCMDNIPTLFESVWTDIHKRSNGAQTRKEDDVDHMDRDGFFDYLNDNYEYIGNLNPRIYGPSKSKQRESISLPIFQYDFLPYNTYIEFNGNGDRFLSIKSLEGKYIFIPYIKVLDKGLGTPLEPSVLFELKKNFNVEEVYEMNGFQRHVVFLNVRPNDGSEPTNRFFLEVIDFMNENIEEPLKKTFVKK